MDALDKATPVMRFATVLRHETRILWGFVVVVGLDVDFENFDWDSVLGKVVECLSRSQ